MLYSLLCLVVVCVCLLGVFMLFLFVVFVFPGIFIHALAYAGVFCVMLLILLPVAMLYRGRYQLQKDGEQIVPGGRVALIASSLFGLGAIALWAFL